MQAEIYVPSSIPAGMASGTACASPSPIGQAFGVRQKVDIDRTAPSGSSRATLRNTSARRKRS